MFKSFQAILKADFPQLYHMRVGVAISGGVDSVVLNALLHEAGIPTSLIHVNFNLRGAESDGDAYFVKELAGIFNSEFYFKDVDTQQYSLDQKCSIQLAARELRYDFFEELVSNDTVDCVLTAHHLDDQLETFLINLGRGTGIRGLTSIPAQSAHIMRPLLSFSREDIEQYANENHLKWREDSSNATDKYLRNDLRINIIPALKTALPHLIKTLPGTFDNLKDSQLLGEMEVSRFRESYITPTSQGDKIPVRELVNTLHPKAYLFELLRGKGFDVNEAVSLLNAESGKVIYGNDLRLIRDRDYLLLVAIEKPAPVLEIIEKGSQPIKIGELIFRMEILPASDSLRVAEIFKEKNIILLDADLIDEDFTLRSWQNGDKMLPFGMKGHKKISDLLIDHKISLLDKEKVLVLENDGKILWLVGIRSSEHFKITPSTKKILKIWFTP
jgi:tRNA(Ile)-lysidine synthase